MQPGHVQPGHKSADGHVVLLEGKAQGGHRRVHRYRHAQAALGVDEKARKDLPSQIRALARLQQDFSVLMSCATA